MRLAVAAAVDRLRLSLFFVPMLGVLLGIALGELMLAADRAVDSTATLPLVLTSTVESSRSVLSTIATVTISLAGIAFSVSLLILQQAATQFSPRVVHGLFRDPFNRRVMGVALGVFSYSLVVLRAVRAPEESGIEIVIPNLSVAVAVLLGIVAILALVGLINHIAHTMEVSEVLARVLSEARDAVSTPAPEGGEDRPLPAEPTTRGCLLRAGKDGWVQQIDPEAMLALVPAGGLVRMETGTGRYVFAGSPLATIWPPPEDHDTATACARDAVLVGSSRTVKQDPVYGLRQLVDVALIALSPGVNDATTAQDAMFHAGALLARLLVAPQQRMQDGEEGRLLLLPHAAVPAELVALTFTEVRQSAASLPDVCIYLLECLLLVRRTLEVHATDPNVDAAIDNQARLVVEGAARAGSLPADLDRVRHAHARHLRPQERV